MTSESGVIAVIRLGEKFEIMATNTFANHRFMALLVVTEDEMFLRSKTHGFCISDGKTE